MGKALRVIQAVAAVFFLLAVVSALELVLRWPADGRSLGWYALHGIAFFDADSFAPGGRGAHLRFLVGAGGFFATVLGALVGAGIAAARRS